MMTIVSGIEKRFRKSDYYGEQKCCDQCLGMVYS
jgi:hypothetical protein